MKIEKNDLHAQDQTGQYEAEGEMLTTSIAEPRIPDLDTHIKVITGEPISEQNEDLILLAFPTLFPYGEASFLKRDPRNGKIKNARKILKKLMTFGRID